VRDVRDALMVARTTDGKLVSRPLSPHMQIYRWPLSMVLSISHRVSGVALSAGTVLLAWWLVAAAMSEAAFATVQSFIASPVGLVVLVGWTLALFFHLLSGIRHLVWDAGFAFDRPWYNLSGWVVVVATVAATAASWLVGLAIW